MVIPCRKPNCEVMVRADQLCRTYGLRLGSRDEDYQAIVVTKGGLALRQKRGQLIRWHSGLLHTLRESGTRHPWSKLGELSSGDQVLDCTLGLGTDARFISELTHELVVGLESSLPIYLLSAEGLATVEARVRVIHQESLSYLIDSPSGSFDVVIADPMFPPTLTNPQHGLDMVRGFGDYTTLSSSWLREAQRVARRWVIIKDHRRHHLLERLSENVESVDLIWCKGKRSSRYGRWRATYTE